MYDNLLDCFNLTVNVKSAVKLPHIYILLKLLWPIPTLPNSFDGH